MFQTDWNISTTRVPPSGVPTTTPSLPVLSISTVVPCVPASVGGSQPTPCLFPANVLSVPGSVDASSGPESVPGWANASTPPEPADASPVPGSTNASAIPGLANTTPCSNQPIIPIWIIFCWTCQPPLVILCCSASFCVHLRWVY